MKMLKIASLVIVLGLLVSYMAISHAEQKYRTAYQINYTINNLNAKITLNGVPIFFEPKTSISAASQVEMWLLNGKNTFEIEVNKLAKTKENESERFSCGIKKLEIPDPYDPKVELKETDLVKYEIPKATDDIFKLDPSVKFPLKQKFEFQVNNFPATYMATGPKITLDDKAKKEIANLVLSYHKAMSINDIDAALKMMSFNLADTSKAMSRPPMDTAKIRKQIDSMLAYFKKEKLKLLPLKASDLQYNLIANGKIVWVTLKGGVKPPILYTGEKVSTPMYVGLVDGKWTIVR